MNEFVVVKKPESPNWKIFYQSLVDSAQALKDADMRPSIAEQSAILNLLSTNIKQVFAIDLKGDTNGDRG